MFIAKKCLSRRTLLRGAGAAVALPLLDSMVPAGTALAQTAARPQSRFASRREDRGWIESEEYYRLMLAAMTEVTTGSAELAVVTGLPVAYYQDKEILQAQFLGEHRVQREGRRWQTFRVNDCRVIPQPFGAVLAMALDDNGRITNNDIAHGNIGVMDIGGKTTNLLSVHRLAEIAKETSSINPGAWDVVRQVREYLSVTCPELDLRDHEIVQAITQRWVRYFGKHVDLTEIVEATIAPMAEQVIAQASQLWNAGARLDAILIFGGGALRAAFSGRQEITLEDVYEAIQNLQRSGIVMTPASNGHDDEPPDIAASLDNLGL